jgi:hypothetical protein
MSAQFGMTTAGFVPKTLTDVQSSLETKLKGLLSQSLDISARSLWGQVIGIFAGELAECWEGEESNQSDLSPDNAAGAALVDLSGITGTLPLGAQASTVTETLVGATGTAVPAATVVQVQGRTNTRFDTDSLATLASVAAWAASTTYALGARARTGSGGASRVYQATQGGISAGSGSGPAGTGTAIVDNTVVWRHLGLGDGAVDVSMSSEVLDAITAPAFTLTQIASPVIGLNAAVNLLDADVGRPDETDPELRLRRETDLRSAGNAAVDSIKARVEAVNGVASAIVFRNDTDTTNGDGVPPHAIEVVVDLDAGPPANVNDLIRAAIWSAAAGGIRMYGQVTGTVIDASGNTQEVDFSFLQEVAAYLRLDLEVTNDFPSDGIAQVIDQLLAFEAARLRGGYDLVAMQVAAEAFNVPGVFNVSNVQVGTTSPASGTRVTATSRQVVTIDTGRMTINATVVTP